MLYSDQNSDTFQIDAMVPHSEIAPYTISICVDDNGNGDNVEWGREIEYES